MYLKSKRITIKKKIIIFSACLFLTSIILTKFIIDNYFDKSFKVFVEEDMRETYFKGIKTLEDYFYFNNINEDNINLGDLSRFPSFLSNRINLNSIIFDLENNPLGVGMISEEIKLDELYEVPENVDLVKENKSIVELDKNENVIGKLIYGVYSKENLIGKMVVIKDYTATFNNDAATKSLIIRLITLMYFILFIGIYFIISKTTKPIETLKNSLRKITEGSYEKIENKSKDEIGELIETFNFMSTKLKKKDEQEKMLFRNITHELKTPLTSISGYAQILKDDPEVDFKNKSLDRIISESNRMHGLIVSILDISKQSSDLEEYGVEEVSILDLIKENIEKLSSKIKLKDLDFEIKNLGEDFKVVGNKYYLNVLMGNLIDNAIKYSFENSKIKLKLSEEENKLVLSIENEGQAIDEDLRNKIFEPFTKGSTTAFANKTSSGLGLYICKNIVDSHRGEIICESNENKSKFILKLPKSYTLEISKN